MDVAMTVFKVYKSKFSGILFLRTMLVRPSVFTPRGTPELLRALLLISIVSCTMYDAHTFPESVQ
jgi:hypothetical protein